MVDSNCLIDIKNQRPQHHQIRSFQRRSNKETQTEEVGKGPRFFLDSNVCTPADRIGNRLANLGVDWIEGRDEGGSTSRKDDEKEKLKNKCWYNYI